MERKRKEEEKGGTMGIQIFFISSRTGFFITAVVIFWGSKMKTISEVSIIKFAIVYEQNLNGGSIRLLTIAEYPTLFWKLFPNSMAVLRIY